MFRPRKLQLKIDVISTGFILLEVLRILQHHQPQGLGPFLHVETQ
jgi:hypothetical protein